MGCGYIANYVSKVMFEPSYNIKSQPYLQWLLEWLSHLPPAQAPTKILLEAIYIETPLIKDAWNNHLCNHPHQSLVHFFLQSLSTGFQIVFKGSTLQSAKKNLQSTVDHPQVVEGYISNELVLRRMSGPYSTSSCTHVYMNRFGVLPKIHQPNKWCLITDLSYPLEDSVNDGIPPVLCSLSYVTMDDAILSILQSGRGMMLAKIDTKSAFGCYRYTQQTDIF